MDSAYTDTAIDPETGLTVRERLFVDLVISDPNHNQTQAYLKAGYRSATTDTARKSAQILINKADVQAYYSQRQKERADRYRPQADAAVRELLYIAQSDITDYVIDPQTGALDVRPGVPREALRAVASYKSKSTTRTLRYRDPDRGWVEETAVTWTGEIRLHSKPSMIELLFKHLGLVTNDLPPLEVLLSRLPPKVADVLRRLIIAGPQPRATIPG
jgi:hypothetical protein